MALIQILTAAPKAGKTQAALALAGARAVFFVPSPQNANPDFNALPWEYARNLKPAMVAGFQTKYPVSRLVLGPNEWSKVSPVFMADAWTGYTFIFDDFPVLFPYARDAGLFAEFAAGIRHRDGRIIVTTQRISGILPPLVRALSDEITQVGPLIARDEARNLYVMGGSATFATYEEFYQAISRNKKYSLFSVKST